jgi:HD superfamily phosphohydrolase
MSIIKDVIHRFVKVPELCRQFIDTSEFNRLRRIKQLGLAHYVYPSATHTRFEHSIGVMCLAGKVADVLEITGREKELLQLAGLLHDAGHVAFSHLMDYILEEKHVQSEISHHEFRSIFILKTINSRIQVLTEHEINMVSKMILGDSSNQEKPYLFEIINNKICGLDVDRLDYLQRDMYHIGMPCFQADYILECMKIKDGHLAVVKKARSEIEMLYEARKRLLLLVCRHKTVMKVEKIMRVAIEKLDITGKWFENNWLKLDDGRLHCMIEEICPSLLQDLDTRNWYEIDINTRFEHISYITREDIDKQMGKVLWC